MQIEEIKIEQATPETAKTAVMTVNYGNKSEEIDLANKESAVAEICEKFGVSEDIAATVMTNQRNKLKKPNCRKHRENCPTQTEELALVVHISAFIYVIANSVDDRKNFLAILPRILDCVSVYRFQNYAEIIVEQISVIAQPLFNFPPNLENFAVHVKYVIGQLLKERVLHLVEKFHCIQPPKKIVRTEI